MNAGLMEGMIGDASGQVGQGLAYVLPETKSDKFFLQQSIESRDNMAKQILAREQMRQQKSLAIDKTLRDKYSSPESWTPLNNAVSAGWGRWTDEATSLKARGIDPTSDPGMLKKFDDLKKMASYSNDLKSQYVKLQSALLTNESKYDGVQAKKLQTEYDELMKDPEKWYREGRSFSPLKGKEATFEDMLKGVKGVATKQNDGQWETIGPDTNANKKLVLAGIMSDPAKYANAASVYGVNTAELPFNYGDTIPTDEATVRKLTNGIMNSSSKDALLERAGIKNDEFAGERLYDHILKENTNWDKMLSSASAGLNAQVSTGKKRVYTAEQAANAKHSLSIREKQLGLAYKKEARISANQERELNKEDTRGAFIQGIQDWKGDALNRFDQALFEIDVNGTKATRKLSPDGKMMVVRVPTKAKDKVGNDIVKWEEYKFTKGVRNAKGKDMINTILNRSQNFGTAKSLKVNPYDESIEESVFGIGELDDL